MYDPTTELMRALAWGIERDETLADSFTAAAGQMTAPHDKMWAGAFRSHSRLHRVKAIELRAQLGALEEQYGSLHRE